MTTEYDPFAGALENSPAPLMPSAIDGKQINGDNRAKVEASLSGLQRAKAFLQQEIAALPKVVGHKAVSAAACSMGMAIAAIEQEMSYIGELIAKLPPIPPAEAPLDPTIHGPQSSEPAPAVTEG